jgi:hypothetical protein
VTIGVVCDPSTPPSVSVTSVLSKQSEEVHHSYPRY